MNAIYSLDKNLIAPDIAFNRPKSVVNSNINPYNNASGGTSDIIPAGFKELSKEKTLAKLGFNIDKNLSFANPVKFIKDKDDKDKDKDKNRDRREEQENNIVTITESSRTTILRPTVITEEDEE